MTCAFVYHSHRDSRYTRASGISQYSQRHGVIRSRWHTHTPRLLRAFSKTKDLAPSRSKRIELALDKISVSYL